MKVYRIKHVPTGLYYKPSKYRSKCNLSKRGKIYASEPKAVLKGIMSGGYRHPEDCKQPEWKYRRGYPTSRAHAGEFIIEEVTP